MSCRIISTTTFEKSLKRLAKHYKSLKADYIALLDSLSENPLQGVDLGGGIRKVRMSITSKGKGKSAGARVITYKMVECEDNLLLYLVQIYDKSERDTIKDQEIFKLLRTNGLV